MSSKNKPHEIISGAGWLIQFARGVITGLREHGAGDDAIHRLGTQAGAEEMERGIAAFVEVIAPTKDNDYLRFLQTANIASTEGEVTLAEASDIFTGGLYGDFKSWGTNVPGEDADETAVDVYEMAKGGNYQTLFGSLGDPRELCLTQGQINEFCNSHRTLLRQEGYGTFFLFEVNRELLVAGVSVLADELTVSAGLFAHDFVWGACDRHRLVVKQQTL